MITGIENSSTRLIAIVNDFLDASKLEQGKIQLKLQKMPLQSAISSVIEEISAIANEKSLYVEATIHSIESMPEVYADPERVEQVVYNLVGNALKFVEHGGVTIHAERQEKFVKVFITDTGSGISKENQQLLFRKFQQANIENKETNSVPGTGLGLYISKLLVENMGGVVALESSIEGKGSTFSFTLPIAE
jgi:signal transduction histidine kinase